MAVQVVVRTPVVCGPLVRFSWLQLPWSGLQLRPFFHIAYPGTPVHRAAPELLLEIFLSLQLPVLVAGRAHRDDVVEIRLPSPVPQPVVDWWLRYHGLTDQVHVTPTTTATGYTPWSARRQTSPGPVAVTFGGGKDSTLAAEAAAEEVGPDGVLLLHAVHPFNAHPRFLLSSYRRGRRTVLADPRRRGFRTAGMVTDFMGNLGPRKLGRPGVNLYLTAGLPILLHHRCTEVSVSHTAGGYVIRRREDGSERWMNAGHRPEALDALTRHHREVLGTDLQAVGSHYPIGELISFGTLLRRYPSAFASITMCMRATEPGRRWCLDCKKCLEYAVFGLALGRVDPDFDHVALLTSSAYVQAVVREAAAHPGAGAPPSPWPEGAGTRTHVATMLHALHLIGSTPPPGLDLRAAAVLRQLADAFTDGPRPGVTQIPRAAAERATGTIGRAVLRAATDADFPLVDGAPVGLLDGDVPAVYRYGESMPGW